ncbi:hypothetical protein LOTGIDRAFT_140712, partial [Lottia gigantea]
TNKMKLFPKTVTGPLHAQNKNACDWGWQGLLAFGCQNYVNIVDPKTLQVIQVLQKHKSNVVKVKWGRENYHHDVNSPYTLRLATADTNGIIVVWDVAQGHVKSEFSENHKPVQDIEWLTNQDASRDLLVALHPPYSLILWNADTGTRLWKKSYTEPLLSFSFDPFNSKDVVFLGQDCIVFVDDFTITKTPSSNGKKYYISSPSSQASQDRKSSMTSSSSSKNLAKKMSHESIPLNECLQLSYHRSCRHHILLLYSRELLILDLEINQTVGIIAMDRSSYSPFQQIIPCWQRDVILCLHENGGISARVRRKTNVMCTPAMEDDSPPSVSLDVAYELRCQSDPLRITRHQKVFGIMVCPVSESSVALVMSDSRVIFWEMKLHSMPTSSSLNLFPSSPLHTPGAKLPSDKLGIPSDNIQFPVFSSVEYPKVSLADMISQSQLPAFNDSSSRGHTVQLKFLMTGLINGVTSHVTCIRMCPPLTNKNFATYQPLVVVGSSTGTLQIINVASGQIDREYNLHTSTVRGLEWTSLKTFLSYSHHNPGVSGLVKNEIFLLDILSGKSTAVRTSTDDESPIISLQVSNLKQYFVLAFKDKPLELWDLKSLTIIRELPKSFPRPTSTIWSPSHSSKTMKKKLLDHGDEDKSPKSPVDVMTSSSHMSQSDSNTSLNGSKGSIREHFVMTDKDGTVFHFIVEGSSISDVTKIPPESGLGTITCLAWKHDYLMFGDVDGILCCWDLKSKISRTVPTNRGWIRKIRFAPGRENYKFFTLHNDGIVVWDFSKDSKVTLHYIKSPKEISKISDCEWAGSDRPMFITTNGELHISDLTLHKSQTSIDNWDLSEPVFCPHLLSSKASQLLKCLLQHQPWEEKYRLIAPLMREEDVEMANIINNQIQLIDRSIANYLPQCQFGIAERCLITARLFGDESDLHFWTVAMYYLKAGKYQPMNKVILILKVLHELYKDQPLERCYDTLIDFYKFFFQKYQLDRVVLHDNKRATNEHTEKCAENYILLGQTDRAVQLLLETDAENSSYYVDSLRACLVASIRSSGASQSTIKLVATNLIANGKLSEGIQLLCLIDKSLDACRYLQTYGAWDKSVWLAKATLDHHERSELLKRYADHLCSTQVNLKSKAVLVLLSLGQFYKVIEMLYGMRCFDRAVCFIESCQQFNLLNKTEETGSLLEAVYLEYARFLTNLGHRKAAEYYCRLAGSKGEQLMKEVEILFS